MRINPKYKHPLSSPRVQQVMLPGWLHAGHTRQSWWRHQIETFSALLAICAGNSPVTGEVPAQRPVTRSFDVFFDLRPNKRLSKQWWGWDLRRHRAHYDVSVRSRYLKHGKVLTPRSTVYLAMPRIPDSGTEIPVCSIGVLLKS